VKSKEGWFWRNGNEKYEEGRAWSNRCKNVWQGLRDMGEVGDIGICKERESRICSLSTPPVVHRGGKGNIISQGIEALRNLDVNVWVEKQTNRYNQWDREEGGQCKSQTWSMLREQSQNHQ
jgi:hypothetical protein